MIIDVTDLSPNATYHLMTQTVIPRPIAWVLTQNADKNTHNLAPFSYFNAVASDPPLLMISCAPKSDGTAKDTVVNVLREKQLVIHIPNEDQLQAVQNTAKPLDYGQSELPLTDLTLCDFGETGLKRITQAPIAFACQLHKTETLGNAPQTLIFAEIKSMYVTKQAVHQQNKRTAIDATRIAALARLGGSQFIIDGKTVMPNTN